MKEVKCKSRKRELLEGGGKLCPVWGSVWSRLESLRKGDVVEMDLGREYKNFHQLIYNQYRKLNPDKKFRIRKLQPKSYRKWAVGRIA